MKKILSILIVCGIMLSLCSFAGISKEQPIFSDGFEKGMDNWTYWDQNSKTNTKILSDACSEGESAYYFYDNSNETSVGIKSIFVDVKPGETYTACVDIFTISGTVSMYFKYYDENSKQIFSKSAKGEKGKWSFVKITETAPEGAVKCQINLCGNNASLGEGFFDNVRIYKGDVTEAVSSAAKAPLRSLAPEPENKFIDTFKEGDVIFEETFEGDIKEGWSTGGKILVEVRDTNPKDGKKSLYVNDDSDTYSGGLRSISYPATPGVIYSVTADLYNEKGQVSVYIKFFDIEGKALSSVSKTTIAYEAWSPFVLNSKAPEGTVAVQVWIYTADSSKKAGYADNVKLIKGYTDDTPKETTYIPPKQPAPVNASLVAPVNNKLSYMSYTDKGDIIGDYSYGGFYAGQYELPVTENLPVIATLSPTGTEDDTKMLQEAIDKAYSENTDGRMKVIKLKAGTYKINKTGIYLRSNLILSGEGQGPEGTILYAKEPVNHFLLRIEGKEPVKAGETANITDEYIPSGSNRFNLSSEDVKNFKVGDYITIYHPCTDAWSEALGMKGITNNSNKDTSWDPGEVEMKMERTITAINGTEITVDFGIFVPVNKSYSQAYIYKTDESGRIENAGVENLRLESYYNGDLTDENHATIGVAITNAKNIFVRDISAKYFYSSAVSCRVNARQVTVLNCSSLQPASKITGSRRYSFASSTTAQQLLFTGCYSYDGRHDFETSFPVTGPIAFVDNLVDKSNTASETHGTWSTGVLYDNLYQVPNGSLGFIAVANRGIYGTSLSQGWTSASSVIWNCLSTTVISHKPPLNYQNFVVGSWGLYQDPASEAIKKSNIKSYKGIYRTGKSYEATDANFLNKEGSPFVGDSYVENEFTPVEPRSLYKAQLSERITGVITNARPNAPVLVYPRADKKTADKKVTVSGAYQSGADAVTVYIDNNPYKANLDTLDNSFEFTIELNEGTHKIYATQTINGVEGCKTADRFIIIGKPNGNPEYLQSRYTPDKTRLLINDPRPTFDKVQYNDKITVMINGKELKSDVEPFETGGRVLVPMRAIFEALAAEVSWDEATATAIAKKDGIAVKITENKTTTFVNDKPYELDVPAIIKNGRFVVPVRFISESFGCNVDWVDETKTVVIKGVE